MILQAEKDLFRAVPNHARLSRIPLPALCLQLRPLLEDDSPVDVLRRLAGERGPLYEEAADLAIDTDGRSPDDVADDVGAFLERLLGAVS